MMFSPRRDWYMDSSVFRTVYGVSNLYEELRSNILRKRRSKYIGFVGDWGVGKDSLVLKMLDMDIPDPKVERDHPYVRRRNTRDIPNLISDQHFDLTIRIIPGKYSNRERDENFFDYIRPGNYEFDALAFCFALNCSTSFYNLENKWIPKAKIALDNKMPFFILVGTKSDLAEVVITKVQALHLQASTRAVDYSSCSARKDIDIVPIRNMLLNILTYRSTHVISTT